MDSYRKPLRIFFITHTYALLGGGGGELFVSNFLEELSKRGHKIFVFAPFSFGTKELEKKFGLESYLAPIFGHHAFHKFEYVLFSPKAVELAKKFNPDIIHAQNDAFPGLIGCIVKKFTKKPLVLAVEYLSDEAVSLNLKIVFALNRFLLPRLCYDKIISWSECVYKNFFLKWKIPKNKILLIPGGINMENHLSAKPSKEFIEKFGKKTILSVKPLHKTNAKGISFIIQAMKIVAEKHPDYKYVIAGEGTGRPKLEALAKELGLFEKNVFFIPRWFRPIELPPLYAAADILVHSFVFKATTSASLLESMACGKPIVATDIGEIRHTVKDAAILVKPRNPESIAQGIIKLIENPALKKSLGEKAREIAKNNYSIQHIVDEYEKLYYELAKKRL